MMERLRPVILVALAGCAAGALVGCATAGPSPSAIAIERADDGLVGARSVWVAAASSRTGGVADVALAEFADVSEEVLGAVRRTRGLELAPTRDQADLVLYFERADRLRCWGCRQPENLWYWWGWVADRSGRELASLHGETGAGADAAAKQFVKSVKSLARD